MIKQFDFLRAEPVNATRHFKSEEEDSLRTKFDRDRDRILFSKEFRRLEGKTQVFVNGFDDHIRNRLTHTLEVSQISQSITKYFGFNRTLSESIALGHDVGHTPFGHIGERVLNFLTNNCDVFKDFTIESENERGFKHNWQGLKVLSTLEKIHPQYKGLNLTDYTLWGILHHSSLKYKNCKQHSNGKCQYRHNGVDCHMDNKEFLLTHYNKYNNYLHHNSWSLEGLIVNNADEIAQRHHDIEDGLVADIIQVEELVEVFRSHFENILTKSQKTKLFSIKKSNNLGYTLHDLSSLILSFYSLNLISNSEIKIKEYLDKYSIKTSIDFLKKKSELDLSNEIFELISFEETFKEKDNLFQDYLVDRILNSHLAQTMDGKASYILRNIIQAYLTNPKQLPDGTIITLMKNYLTDFEYKELQKKRSAKLTVGIMREQANRLHNNNDTKFKTTLIRTITDFIAGMTDKFALSQYRMLYGSDNYWLR